ncbi:MAG: S41 family peptidase [Acidobacteriota bacterium]|jgi:carboxyl-terminal processing protease|nr:S41 family peptidase [Acidobacteriota bacterium]
MLRIKPKLLVFLGSFLIVLYGVSAAFYAGDDAYKELSVFINVIKRINADYVEAPDMSRVQEGAMRGLLNALDPYSSFLSKEQYAEYLKRKENGQAGVGLVLSKRSDMIYVVSCERDGPADIAGVRPGDYVIAVDGQGVEDRSLIEVDGLLRGAKGSKLKLTIFRSLKAKSLEVEMVRSDPSETLVTSRMLDGKVGFLDVASLAGSSLEQAKLKLKTLISAGAEKIILDLRDCAEGSASNGADLANFFMKSGTIFYSQNRQGERIQVVEAVPEKFITDLPVVVLLNGSTAGAAEITAGALKDAQRATLIGEKSFGQGSSQKTIQLKSGAALILSTAKYYTPGGKVIQNETLRNAGIDPDVEVPDSEMKQDLAVESYYDEQEEAVKYKKIQEKVDKIQVDKALEILLQPAAPLKKAA